MPVTRKIGTCSACGETRRLFAGGLCYKCHPNVGGRASHPKAPRAGTPRITVDFSSRPHVLEALRKRAGEDLRTVPAQIVFELDRLLTGRNVAGGAA